MWTIPKHCKDIKQYKKTLDLFKAKKGEEIEELGREEIMKRLEEDGVFKPRKENTYNKTTYGHKILDPHFYGMLYRGKEDGKVHISANGDLLSKYWGDYDKRRKIFLSMLMNVQFPNPAKPKVREDVRLYPYRLIFELITEERLDNFLTTDEIANILYRVKKVETEEEKEEIIQRVISYRMKNKSDKNIELQKEEDSCIIADKSLDYTLSVLESIGLTKRIKTEDIFEIKRKGNVKKKEEKIKSKKVIMTNEVMEFYKKIQQKRKVTDPVVEKTMYSEWVRQLYNNVADELIEELGTENLNLGLLQLPQKLIEASKESDNWQKFEDVLVDAYNVFDDLRSEKIAGAGQPDVVSYFTNKNKVFTTDAKSTNTKLTSINPSRIKRHMNLYRGSYALVITPEYRVGAKYDIENEKICIMTSYCFSDLINRYVLKRYENGEECLFEEIDYIIENNLGTDISEKIYEFIDIKMGTEL